MVLDSAVILTIILQNSNSNSQLIMEYKNILMKGDANTVRYLLKKEGKRILYVIGINPSTANETKPDRTLGRVMGFAEENGFDGFAMVNLYHCFRDIVSILQPHSPQWKQIGNLTGLGNPRHPLYARKDSFRDFDIQQYLKRYIIKKENRGSV